MLWLTGIHPGYIPRHLSKQTKALLMAEMQKDVSEKDEPGFIYCAQLRELYSSFHDVIQ